MEKDTDRIMREMKDISQALDFKERHCKGTICTIAKALLFIILTSTALALIVDVFVLFVLGQSPSGIAKFTYISSIALQVLILAAVHIYTRVTNGKKRRFFMGNKK